MRLFLMAAALMLTANGCAPVGASGPAVCDGSAALRTAHAAALAADGGAQSVATGAQLIRALDAGCR